ncbi:MAG TPA: arylamine N-acetyltransferase [Thermoanaerobaculia bacterium]|nr:arylamine N-acetyltransferase [Thermoanaerobaculia bacterium]
MPATWTDAYLRRLGYGGARTPSREVLRELHELHLLRVPFENLDIHWQRPIVVDEMRFIRKIVEGRRGGFCYELNGAFGTLLRELGFEVAHLSARVPKSQGEGLGPPFDHMALLVTPGDGSRWLADVGFGDSFFSPLTLDNTEAQRDRNGIYRIERDGDDWRYLSKRGEAWALEYLFSLEPHALDEFAPMCDFQQSSPDSAFTKKRICSLATENGRVSLTDSKLIITHGEVKEEIPVPAAEWARVLEETFGIEPPLSSGA